MSTVLSEQSVEARQSDQAAIRIVAQLLSDAALQSGQRPQLRGPDGQSIDLPESVVQLLRKVVHILAQGDNVSIVPVHKELTTQQAADILNVSRPHLVTLLERGVVPFSHIGRHRRIKFSELMNYKRQRDEERRAQLAELTRVSEELGMYQ